MHSYKKIDFSNLESVLDDLLLDVPRTELLSRKDIAVSAMGSCFAKNIATAMAKQGYNAQSLNVSEDHNTPVFSKAALDIMMRGNASNYFDTFAPILDVESLPRVRHIIEQSKFFVLTFGVGFLWLKNGVLAQPKPRSMKEYTSHFPTAAEHAATIGDVIDMLAQFSAGMHVVVTISPVPLLLCTNPQSQIVADCLSKSLLRAGLHEALRRRPAVTYFPSFELFRWVSGHQDRKFFGVDDVVRHPDADLVDLITAKFIAINGGQSAVASQSGG